MAGFVGVVYFFFIFIAIALILRFLSKTSLLHILVKSSQSLIDRLHVYQFYKVPQFNANYQENQLYRKIAVYLNSLPAIEDSDFTNLFSGPKSNDIFFHYDADRSVVRDAFFGAKVSWTNHKSSGQPDGIRSFVLRIRKSEKRRVFRQYFQHILTVADEIEQQSKEIKLYMNLAGGDNGRWRSVPFTHPATFDTVVMDAELKSKIRTDLENFSKSKQYYHRLGRVWRRSYLLYGGSGTGKTSFVAAMARLLSYDVYDVDFSKVVDDADLKLLLLQTTTRSLIVVEDLDRFLAAEKSTSTAAVSLSGLLNFMDGIVSSCGEERILVFTMTGKDQVDPLVLRPGRVDVHIHFPGCDFSAFKSLASSYLGVKEHKLFPQVEEVFQNGGSLSPAEIGEIMISNRSSPSRALKSVISALQTNAEIVRGAKGLTNSSSGRSSDGSGEPATVFCRESIHTVREFRKLYGLLRLGSRRKEEPPLDLTSAAAGAGAEKDGSRHERVNL